MAAFEESFSIGKEPASRSTITRAFTFLAKFIIAKYLKQEVDDNLSVFVDQYSPCGLSIIEDIKTYHCQRQAFINFFFFLYTRFRASKAVLGARPCTLEIVPVK